MKEKIGSLIKAIPGITLAMIILGNIYAYYYYNAFVINIYSFINPAEAFSFFIPSFYIIGTILLTILICYFTLIRIPINNLNYKLRRYKSKFGILRAKYRFYKINFILFILIVFIVKTVLFFSARFSKILFLHLYFII